jgi:cell division protein FtsW
MIKLFGDKFIWTISFFLILISILLVYSSGGNQIIFEHLTHCLLGLGLMFICSRFNYRYFTNLSSVLLFISFGLLLFLILPAVFGDVNIRTTRWIKISIFSFQPSELAKYSLILFLCRNIFLYQDKIPQFKYFLLYIILPTLGVVMLILPSNLSGYKLSLYFLYVVFPLIIVSTLFFLILVFPTPSLLLDSSIPTWKNRICSEGITYIDCNHYNNRSKSDTQYQKNKAKAAISRGKVFGQGAGKSHYKRALPESKTDFIFAILIEEYGLAGGIAVLCLYLLFYQRIIVLSVKSKDDFPRLLLLGLGTVIVVQALLNISVAVNLMPVTGQTLPLISKGGSSLWATALAFGIILNISHQINIDSIK